jgi:hypothetical protein
MINILYTRTLILNFISLTKRSITSYRRIISDNQKCLFYLIHEIGSFVIYLACICRELHYFEFILQNNKSWILRGKGLFPAAVGFLTDTATSTAAVLKDTIKCTSCNSNFFFFEGADIIHVKPLSGIGVQA